MASNSRVGLVAAAMSKDRRAANTQPTSTEAP